MKPPSDADDLSLTELRGKIDRVNCELLDRLQERAALVQEIAAVKRARGLEGHDPGREDAMLEDLLARSQGPFGPAELRTIFRTIFRASLEMQERDRWQGLRVKQPGLLPPGGVRVGKVAIGDGPPVMIAGPCSAESAEQMDVVAASLATYPGGMILRAGAYKPRTNPYSFQGLREEGLDLIEAAGARHHLPTVTEVLDGASVERVAAQADMLQVGSRNMYNTELLKALGRVRRPVLLKRGFMATIEEFILAAEYIVSAGNPQVVFCERGIRTFERATRNTLDISAVPLLKRETSLPVIVDLSHALGRRDIILPCGRAALAAGADGLMVEVHPDPDRALSDGFQQLDLRAFAELMAGLGLAPAPEPTISRPDPPRRPSFLS
ncbi:MAG TPA: bifunctional 3-deoxy-7-phosphoheptulonate synthase/chorismate mutase [Dongiaceae bacterium]|nr:bifunctional 3-deoxy-7-phosphoheptulonate synthase/chorismate mutase [Dongiaceae bacterium]